MVSRHDVWIMITNELIYIDLQVCKFLNLVHGSYIKIILINKFIQEIFNKNIYMYIYMYMLLMVASCIAGRAPSYLREQYILVSSVPGRRHLRSADQLLLTIPRCHGATAQKCSFSVAGPLAWNCLPMTLREAAVQLPRGSFKKDLKTHLFREVV